MPLTVAEIILPGFVEVAPEDTLGEVADRLTNANVGAAIVRDFGRLIGIISERDLLRAMAARVHSSDARVRQWMTADPVVIGPDAAVAEAERLMLDNNFRHLPVVEDGAVVAILSLRRVAKALATASV